MHLLHLLLLSEVMVSVASELVNDHRPDLIRARCPNQTEPPYPYDPAHHHPHHKPHSYGSTGGPTGGPTGTGSTGPLSTVPIGTSVATVSVSSSAGPFSISNSSLAFSTPSSGFSISTFNTTFYSTGDPGTISGSRSLSILSPTPRYTNTSVGATVTSASLGSSIYTFSSHVYTSSFPVSSSAGGLTASGGSSGSSAGTVSYSGTSTPPYPISNSSTAGPTAPSASIYTSASQIFSSSGSASFTSANTTANTTSTLSITGTIFETLTSTITASGASVTIAPISANSTSLYIYPSSGLYTSSTANITSSAGPISASSFITAPSASITQTTSQCYTDNCLLALQPTQFSGNPSLAHEFCSIYTEFIYPSIPTDIAMATLIPDECNPARLSSACSCLNNPTGSAVTKSTPTAYYYPVHHPEPLHKRGHGDKKFPNFPYRYYRDEDIDEDDPS